MLSYIRDLFAVYCSGDSPNEYSVVRIDDVIDVVLQLLDADIEASRAVLTREPLPWAMSDRALLTAIYQNLITNALKYCGEDPPPLIELS